MASCQLYKRRLLGELCRAALRALTRYFEIVAGSALTPGVIAAIQTFGDRINSHPHLHVLVTEGGVDRAGVFHKIPRLDDSRLFLPALSRRNCGAFLPQVAFLEFLMDADPPAEDGGWMGRPSRHLGRRAARPIRKFLSTILTIHT